MQKKLQQILTQLSNVSQLSFALYRSPEEYLAGTLPQGVLSCEQLKSLFLGEQTDLEGYQVFPIHLSGEEAFLISAGEQTDIAIRGALAAEAVQIFFDAMKKELDRHAYAAALLSGEIPQAQIYKLAARVKLKDTPRVLYLFELAQPMADASSLRMLTSLFADGRQDLLFLQDETHIVCIKAFDSEMRAEQAREYALSSINTIHSELMIRARVGYSTVKQTLPQLLDAHREAALALQISGIFREEREVAAYSKLGIARLIHELPADLCELFLHEVFGDEMPDSRLDEEMQVTIRLFFENNLNVSETARRLFLHRNTLVYRLERLEKLVGLDIRKFEDAMTFQIAMMVLSHYRQM